jgi:hypothetical protein
VIRFAIAVSKKRRARRTIVSVRFAVATLLVLAPALLQRIDPALARAVAAPAFAADRPVVAVDEAHGNAGAASGFFKPLADQLTRDGYRVVALTEPFAAGPLAAIDVLVVSAEASASASATGQRPSGRIGDREGDLVRDWVRGGGSLLVAAGSSAGDLERLAERFGVEAGRGRVFDRVSGGVITTALEFSRSNGLLGEHPILRGRGHSERISRVRTLAGQSLGVPRGAAILLKLSGTAREAMTRNDLEAEEFAARQEAGIAGSFSIPVAGRAQAIALSFGKGRLVVLGDPDLLSAAGSSTADADNGQFALNIVHWLSRQM